MMPDSNHNVIFSNSVSHNIFYPIKDRNHRTVVCKLPSVWSRLLLFAIGFIEYFFTSDGSLDDDEEKEEPNGDVNEKQRHQLKHRELFLSRQVETLPATHIRGKCVVTLLNETESLISYLDKEVSACI